MALSSLPLTAPRAAPSPAAPSFAPRAAPTAAPPAAPPPSRGAVAAFDGSTPVCWVAQARHSCLSRCCCFVLCPLDGYAYTSARTRVSSVRTRIAHSARTVAVLAIRHWVGGTAVGWCTYKVSCDGRVCAVDWGSRSG